MIVDGGKIAGEIISKLTKEVKKRGRSPKLFVVQVGNDYATSRYVSLKQRIADRVGIKVEVSHFNGGVKTDTLIRAIEVASDDADGIIVQLPLPSHIDKQAVLNAIPVSLDIDVLSQEGRTRFQNGTNSILPPVVSAISEILKRHGTDVRNKHAVVVGKGSLVGRPVALWLTNQGANVVSLDEASPNFKEKLKKADIIVTGAGVPNLITPDMIAKGVILLDAATSESEGGVVGDTDPKCAKIASLYSPVPGGIGPVTVASLLKNTVIASRKQ